MTSTPEPEPYESIFLKAEEACPPPTPEQTLLENRGHDHYARLYRRLREPTDGEASAVALLLRRLSTHLRFALLPVRTEMDARTRDSVILALNDIDPYWKTQGLTQVDYARLEELRRAQEDEMLENIDIIEGKAPKP